MSRVCARHVCGDAGQGSARDAIEPIEDYAVIGDVQSVGLVSRGGSSDWLCLPRFDSGACFAALVGTADNGPWSIAPLDRVERAPLLVGAHARRPREHGGQPRCTGPAEVRDREEAVARLR